MPKLFIYPKKGEAYFFTLKKDKISIGRSSQNEIPIDDPYSSGCHAFIYSLNSGYVVRDNSSKNGTFLNGKRIQGEVELKKGDEILIGSTRMIFDKELQSDVEVTDVPHRTTQMNTIIHVKDILKKPDIQTTLRAAVAPAGLDKLKSDLKSFSVLSQVSSELVLHRPLDELLEQIMDLLSEHIPMDRGVLMLREGNPPQLIPKVIRINKKNLENQKIQVSQSIINVALDKHSSILIQDALADPRFQKQESVVKSQIHSAMCVPLWNNKEIIGIVYSDRVSFLDQFSEDDLKLLTLLSNLAAIKIENAKLIEEAIEKQKMERELALAAQIQKDFLPKDNPACENFEIAGANIPCYQVGGDYYDFIAIDPCRWGIVIADVSGKGMGASLLMASLRAALHSELRPLYRLEVMAAKLNDFVQRSSASNCFITFFFCELDKKSSKMSYVNAGHNPPIILRKKKKVERLESGGLCLGMFASTTYEAREVDLDIGDSAVLFTDGITESRNMKNEEFGEEKLINFLQKNSNLPIQKLIEKLFSEIESFSAGTRRMDDMTLVVIRRTA